MVITLYCCELHPSRLAPVMALAGGLGETIAGPSPAPDDGEAAADVKPRQRFDAVLLEGVFGAPSGVPESCESEGS